MTSEKTLINYIDGKIKLLPNVGNVTLYEDVMRSLFGGIVKSISKIELLNKKFIINKDDSDGEVYFVLSELENYIRFTYQKIRWEEEILCPLNYFECLEKLGLDVPMTQEYLQIFQILMGFKNYLMTKEDIHGKILQDIFWNKNFRGIVGSSNLKPYLYSLVFNKKNSIPFIMNIVDGEETTKNLLSIDKENNFDEIYQVWVNNLLMDTPENYIISCLENVTGSLDLANFIFKSHSNKTEFIIDVNDLNLIINFKNDTELNNYLNNFKSWYEDGSIYKNIESEQINKVYLNFEGFNRYLLNLEVSYLKSINDKEVINTIYYNVMDELVNSYQKLYKFFRSNLIVESEYQPEHMV